jgi:predicted O-methyltransferase YrrM
MSEETWAAVDAYLAELVAPEDPALRSAREQSDAAGLPAIQVSTLQGKLLMLLARIQGARQILEIGTLGGYSTIWLARALPVDGMLISLEVDPRHVEVARENLARAGVSASVEVRLGPAIDSLSQLAEEGAGPFDFIFIDADKPSNPEYLEWAIRLSRPGTLTVVDNVVRTGAILDPSSEDAAIVGTRRLFELLSAEPRLEATVIQTVGAKGYDGFALAVVV